ncbi:MAG TPA: hypothetical protein VHC49_11465 [Mycobacteriales bacterium]|nr:hypothetical protein [Mycobacteriales bacterium]
MNAAMDESLFERLAEVAATTEPVPAEVTAAARSAFALRDIDARIAALIRDSADEPELAGVRDSSSDRLLSFELDGDRSEPVTVELQIGAVALDTRDVVGQISGTVLTGATVDTAGESRELTLDNGFFVARGVPAGPVRLRFTTDRGHRIATSWVRV